MKTLTATAAKVITTAIAYVIFLVTSSCVIDKSACYEDASFKNVKKVKPAERSDDNISTTGLVSLNRLQLL